MLLVKTSYTVANEYKGYIVNTKLGNKKHQVYFKVYCDDTDIDECLDLFRNSKNIVMLEYQGSLPILEMKDLTGVYITRVFDFGTNITEEEIKGVVEMLPKGVTGIIRMPVEYSDMRFVHDMSMKYDSIRFCGGTMFCFDGCRIGCCGRDILDKAGIRYDKTKYLFEGCSCALDTVSETEVVLEKGKPQTSTAQKTSRSASPRKKLLFHDLIYQSGKVEL